MLAALRSPRHICSILSKGPTVTDMTASALADALRDRYVLERELGRGGMATVYLAHELRHDRRLALKVLHPHLAATLGPDRFLREIKTTASLSHPHILPLFDSGDANGFLFYTMPYIDGESLRARLTREKQLAIEEALQITREIADALAFAHSRGLLHRDIKPENILLEAGHAVVADFGIAKAITEAATESLTATGLALGTPQYMSPEQAGGTRRLDARTDVYSLACVLYEMLAGDPPFAGSMPHAILARKALEKPTPLRHVRNSISRRLDEAVGKALATTPADRFRTMQEFASSLEHWGTGGKRAEATVALPSLSLGPELSNTLPVELRPLEREVDIAGLTHPGKVHRIGQGNFLICSVGRYMHVHDTSMPDSKPLPREGDRQALCAIIADGVGRGTWGHHASLIAIRVMSQYLVHSLRCYETGDEGHERAFVSGIHEGVVQCQAAIAQRGVETPDSRGMAARLSMFVGIWPRAYVLLDGKNHFYRALNGELAELGKDGLGQLLGPGPEDSLSPRATGVRPVVYRLDNVWEATYLLCSDGISKHVSKEQIRTRVTTITSAAQVCEDLLQDALGAGGTESITMIAGRAVPAPPPHVSS